MATDDRALKLGVGISKTHKDVLDRIMAATRPTPTLRAMIEHLIEKEAAERGIEMDTHDKKEEA